MNPRGFHRLDLLSSRSLTAGNNRSRMAHAASWRRCLPGDETNNRFADVLFYVRGRGLFRIPADFADHDDRVRVRILIE